MRKQDQLTEYAEFVLVLRDHSPITGSRQPLQDAAELRRLAMWLDTDNENRCNRESTPREEKRRDNAYTRAENIAKFYGAKIRMKGDPRGMPLLLVWENGPTNTFGQDGYAVPLGK